MSYEANLLKFNHVIQRTRLCRVQLQANLIIGTILIEFLPLNWYLNFIADRQGLCVRIGPFIIVIVNLLTKPKLFKK